MIPFYLLVLSVSPILAETTFKNVEIKGFEIYKEIFKKKVTTNKLHEVLPETNFDKIEITQQNIPILFEYSLSNLDTLDELVLDRNKIEKIYPGTFRNNPGLRRLSLADNKIEEIKSDVFSNSTLSNLNLSKNRIRKIESNAFDNIPNLLSIDLSFNKISAYNEDWFLNCPSLVRVSLQNNLIKILPSGVFKNLKGKREVNGLSLLFSYNKLESIAKDAFEGIKEMNQLWLDNNKLEKIHPSLLEGVELQRLRLEANQFKCFDDFDKVLKGSKSNYLDENPLDCDCAEKIVQWAEKKKPVKPVDMFFVKMECKLKGIEKRIKKLESE